MKRIIVFLMSFCILLTAAVPALAAPSAPRLFNVYADGMLFPQNSDAVLAGEASNGSVILAELFDHTGTVAASGTAEAKNGRFEVSFRAPAGSFEVYSIGLSCGGKTFASLQNVVFGELWLSAGQSNMEYALRMTHEGKEMEAAGQTGSRNVHVLYLPNALTVEEKPTRYQPLTDAISCSWFTADDPQVYNMSAVAYFFAEKLQQQLQMPVGILSVALGGSCIAPWLSRAAIDGNDAVKKHLTDCGEYYGEERWSDPDRSYHIDMTNLYNTNIAPLTNFRPQGVIWYQGCSEIMTEKSTAYYRDCFNLLQDSYTKDFRYTGGRLPFLFSQLACYAYGKGADKVTEFNQVFTDLAAQDPSSRAMTPIYDLSLAYNEMGAIHPMTKKPIGERLFRLAESLVYGKKSPSCAPICQQAEARDGSVYLTFNNVGSGLKFAGETPRGFAVCGADGVAVQAEAELVSNNTVRVYSPDIKNPVAATYAVGNWSERANLWSVYGGEPYLPAASTGIDNPAVKHHYIDNAWMNCEDLTGFRSSGESGYVDAWNTAGCAVALETNGPIEGNGALRITSQKPLFTLSPNISDTGLFNTSVYDNVDADWSDYGALRLQVKNCGKAPLRLNEVRLYTNAVSCLAPICRESKLTGVTIPADGAWHTVTFDLNRLCFCGIPGAAMTNDRLTQVERICFRWEGANAELLLDDIRVLPESAELTEESGTLLDYLKAWFTAVRDMLLAFFGIASAA